MGFLLAVLKNLRILLLRPKPLRQKKPKPSLYVAAFESEPLTISGVVLHKTKAIHGASDQVVEKMGEVCGYVFEAPGEKCLYLAADTIYCSEAEQSHQ